MGRGKRSVEELSEGSEKSSKRSKFANLKKTDKHDEKTRKIPQFLTKLLQVVEQVPPRVGFWSSSGTEFFVVSSEFDDYLSRVFTGSKLTFVRQLHFYGFRKVEHKDRSWSFSHPYFLRDKPELLYKIQRKTSARKKSRKEGEGSSVSSSLSLKIPERYQTEGSDKNSYRDLAPRPQSSVQTLPGRKEDNETANNNLQIQINELRSDMNSLKSLCHDLQEKFGNFLNEYKSDRDSQQQKENSRIHYLANASAQANGIHSKTYLNNRTVSGTFDDLLLSRNNLYENALKGKQFGSEHADNQTQNQNSSESPDILSRSSNEINNFKIQSSNNMKNDESLSSNQFRQSHELNRMDSIFKMDYGHQQSHDFNSLPFEDSPGKNGNSRSHSKINSEPLPLNRSLTEDSFSTFSVLPLTDYWELLNLNDDNSAIAELTPSKFLDELELGAEVESIEKLPYKILEDSQPISEKKSVHSKKTSSTKTLSQFGTLSDQNNGSAPIAKFTRERKASFSEPNGESSSLNHVEEKQANVAQNGCCLEACECDDHNSLQMSSCETVFSKQKIELPKGITLDLLRKIYCVVLCLKKEAKKQGCQSSLDILLKTLPDPQVVFHFGATTCPALKEALPKLREALPNESDETLRMGLKYCYAQWYQYKHTRIHEEKGNDHEHSNEHSNILCQYHQQQQQQAESAS